MTARMPKSHLRLNPLELLPGEHGIIRQFDVIVDKQRRVYVRKTSIFVGIFGVNEWPDHQHVGEALIRKREDEKFDLLIRGTFSKCPEHIYAEEYKNLIPIQELVILGTRIVECGTCFGKGVVKVSESQ